MWAPIGLTSKNGGTGSGAICEAVLDHHETRRNLQTCQESGGHGPLKFNGLLRSIPIELASLMAIFRLSYHSLFGLTQIHTADILTKPLLTGGTGQLLSTMARAWRTKFVSLDGRCES